jgi:hypothetical protein
MLRLEECRKANNSYMVLIETSHVLIIPYDSLLKLDWNPKVYSTKLPFGYRGSRTNRLIVENE